MAFAAPARPLAAVLFSLAALGARCEEGLADGTLLVQVQGGMSSSVAHSEAAADMVNGMLSLLRGSFNGYKHSGSSHGHWAKEKEKTSIMDGPAGCVWSRDLKASWAHISELLPTIQHAGLSVMMPMMIKMTKNFEKGEVPSQEEKDANKKEMMDQMMKVLEPMKGDLLPHECDQKLIKKKVMSQSMVGGADAEEITAQCIVKATHVTPACARCAGNFLRDFMGRGMMGLANSCVPKCMPANDACKKGMTDKCINKSYPCLKCMKPGLLQMSDCVGLNSTRLGLSNKIDLFAKAYRDGSTSAEGLPSFINDLVVAMNA